ncbi:hypothetical protein [Cupriavidus metallidurans]|uniref:hypothetical protein n=1 Tax=Cupriavidus metallidurans TaxID=119219 RepID=UPI003D02284F
MTSFLRWVGDNIGTQLGAPITIELLEQHGLHIHASVASTLILINRIKADERARILSALRNCAEHGELHPDDLQAYRAWDEDQACTTDCSAAARDVGAVTSLLYSLNWAGEKCENAYDYEQFHVLALELFQHMGLKLEQAETHMGSAAAGLFIQMEPSHG